MNKYLFAVFFIFALTGFGYSQGAFQKLNEELAFKIKYGSGDGELYIPKDDFIFMQQGRLQGFILFDKIQPFVYVTSVYGDKTNIYNYNDGFKYIGKINGGLCTAKRILKSINGNFILLGLNSNDLALLDKEGTEIFFVNGYSLPDELKGYEIFFPYDDNILYYSNNKIFIVDKIGKYWDDQKIQVERQNLLNTYYETHSNFSEETKKELNIFFEKTNRLVYNNILLTGYFDELREYYNILKKNRAGNLKDKAIEISDNARNFKLIEFDRKKNSYWDGFYNTGKKSIRIVIVCSQYGELLAAFEGHLQPDAPTSPMAIAPNGDIYFKEVVPTNGFFNIYRIKNTWDPIDTSAKADTAKTAAIAPPITYSAKATSLTATSFIDYQSMYTPYRVFDGDAKTAWLEAAKGSGIDEAITLALDKEITVDEIRFMPGFFDTQWWKVNNRIKKLVVLASDQTFTFNFADKMEEQAQKLPALLKFTKIKFAIKDVYRSTGDDDTALSEISFYNAGKKVELDMSGVK